MDQEYSINEQELERRRLIRLEIKRKQKRNQRLFYAAAAVIVVLIIVLIARGCSKKQVEDKVEEDKAEVSDTLQQEVKDLTATLTAVGDIMCYEDMMLAARDADGNYDFSPSFASVKELLQRSDLTVGNLELNFCGSEQGYSGYPNFNAPEALAATLADVGFDLVQTANTYSIQNGISGLNNTIRYLTENKIGHVGTYHNQESRDATGGVIMKEAGGIRFAFLGYTKGLNNLKLPSEASYAVDLLYEDYSTYYSKVNKEALLAAVASAKEQKADVIIAMLHWGNEYETEPLATQNEIAELLFKNGVDVILGSHSHEVGPMEKRTVTVDGEEKEVFLAYSLGNFFSSMSTNTAKVSTVLDLEFTMDGETGKVAITKAEYTPLYIADHGEGAPVRFEILPIRPSLENTSLSHMEETLAGALATLHDHAGADLDSGK